MDRFEQHVEDHFETYLQELIELCRIPSVAAAGSGLEEAAEAVAQALGGLGATVETWRLEGAAPVVYAELGDGEPTLLVYNHYDVQPPDPLDLWDSEPFSPEVRDGRLYARGVSDNKGNLMVRIHALRAYQEVFGRLPVRVKVLVEGEEEIGSVHLPAYVDRHRARLAADGCLWEFGYKDLRERPTLHLGLKGLVYVELRARGANRDLHSSWGTIVPNPAWRLVHALASLRDERGRITVDGLEDQVARPEPEAVELLERADWDGEAIRRDLGIERFLVDLNGHELLAHHLLRPALNVCGILSGYTGPGPKTVLPNQAMVKLDFRLVPDLTPELVLRLLREHLDRRGFQDIEVIELGSEPPGRSSVGERIVQAAIQATRRTYGQEPVIYPTSAGSGPAWHLGQRLGNPLVCAGIGYAHSNAHGPNENIRLSDYREGLSFIRHLLEAFAG